MDMGEYDQVIADCNNLIKLDSSATEEAKALNYLIKGTATMYKEDFESSISDLNKSIQLNPNYGEAYSIRAIVYFSKKIYDKSWEDVHLAQSLGGNIHPEFLESLKKESGRVK